MTNGELIWKLDEPMVAGAIADGYTTASDSYDGYMYVFGKGQSQTTVCTRNSNMPRTERCEE